MRTWTVPYTQNIRLPRGIQPAGHDPRTKEYLYYHQGKNTWYRVTTTATGWQVEEWHDSEVDTSGCGEC